MYFCFLRMKFIFILFFLLAVLSSFAQQAAQDSIPKKETAQKQPQRHSVKKAVLYSALVPGLGQIYNKKWWKVPIIYAGFGGLGFALGWNTRQWRTYSDAYRARVDGDPNTVDEFVDEYSEANLVTLKNHYRRNMDLSIIFTSVLYSLNIIDAAVDAHLFEYDISDDLTLQLQPQVQFAGAGNTFTGAALTMRFK